MIIRTILVLGGGIAIGRYLIPKAPSPDLRVIGEEREVYGPKASQMAADFLRISDDLRPLLEELVRAGRDGSIGLADTPRILRHVYVLTQSRPATS